MNTNGAFVAFAALVTEIYTREAMRGVFLQKVAICIFSSSEESE